MRDDFKTVLEAYSNDDPKRQKMIRDLGYYNCLGRMTFIWLKGENAVDVFYKSNDLGIRLVHQYNVSIGKSDEPLFFNTGEWIFRDGTYVDFIVSELGEPQFDNTDITVWAWEESEEEAVGLVEEEE